MAKCCKSLQEDLRAQLRKVEANSSEAIEAAQAESESLRNLFFLRTEGFILSRQVPCSWVWLQLYGYYVFSCLNCLEVSLCSCLSICVGNVSHGTVVQLTSINYSGSLSCTWPFCMHRRKIYEHSFERWKQVSPIMNPFRCLCHVFVWLLLTWIHWQTVYVKITIDAFGHGDALETCKVKDVRR